MSAHMPAFLRFRWGFSRPILVLAALLCALPTGVLCGETWTPMDIGKVPEGSPVWLRLKVDTAALEASVAARWFLRRREDSMRTLPDGRRFLVSELELMQPSGTVKVTGQTWRSLRQGKVRLTFDYLDIRGASGTLDASLETRAIERVFVEREMAPSTGPSKAKARAAGNPHPGPLLLLICPLVGVIGGYYYGDMKGDGGNSQPGMSAFVYSMSGLFIGLYIGIRAAVAD